MANRYWVGGSGTWDATNTANWSATSGGAGGASVPSLTDVVFFNASSGGGTVTLSDDAFGQYQSIDCNGYTGTWDGGTRTSSTYFYVTPPAATAGTLRFGSGMTFLNYEYITFFVSAVTGQTTTITTNGITLGGIYVQNSAGTVAFAAGTHTLGRLTVGSSGTGAFNTNSANFSITVGNSAVFVPVVEFSLPSGPTMALGTSTFTFTPPANPANIGYMNLYLTGTNTTTSNSAKFVFNGNLTSTFSAVNIQDYSSNTMSLFNVEIVDAVHGIIFDTQATSITTFKATQTAARATPIQLRSSMTISNMTVTSFNATSRFIITPVVTAFASISAFPLTLTVGTKSFSNVDFFGISAAGAAAPFNGAGNWGNNSNINFTSAVTRYAVGSSVQWHQTSMWSTSSGGASGATVPLPQDTVIFNGSSTGPYTIDNLYTACIPTLGLSNYTGTFDFNFNIYSRNEGWMIKDTVSLNASTTLTGSPRLILWPSTTLSTTRYLDFKNQTIYTLALQDGAYTLNSNLNVTSEFTVAPYASLGVIAPTIVFDANNYNVTAASVTAFQGGSSTSINFYMRSGTWTLTGSGTVFRFSSVSTNPVTIYPSDAPVFLTYNGTSGRTFYLAPTGSTAAAPVWNKITVGSGSGSGTVTFQGSANITYGIESTKTATYTLRFGASTTVGVGSFKVKGSAGNLVTLTCSSTSSTFTLNKLGSGKVGTVNYLTISRSNATPANTWYAGAGSVNAGTNTGWIFKSLSSGMFMMFS